MFDVDFTCPSDELSIRGRAQLVDTFSFFGDGWLGLDSRSMLRVGRKDSDVEGLQWWKLPLFFPNLPPSFRPFLWTVLSSRPRSSLRIGGRRSRGGADGSLCEARPG